MRNLLDWLGRVSWLIFAWVISLVMIHDLITNFSWSSLGVLFVWVIILGMMNSRNIDKKKKKKRLHA